MNSQGGHVPPVRNPGPTSECDAGAQVISGSDYLRLCRIADASALLARLPSEAAKVLDIEADHTAAVAQYMTEDLTAILSRSRPIDE